MQSAGGGNHRRFFTSLNANLLLASNNFLRLRLAIDRYRRNINVGILSADPELLANLGVDASKDFLVLLEEVADVFTALADALALVAVPGAALVHDVMQYREIQNIALAGDAFAVQDVEFGIAEGCGDLVLYDLYLGA